MNKKIFLISLIVLSGFCLSSPTISLASGCLVDPDIKNEDGSEKEKKFKTIKKAIEKDCKEIILAAGEHNGNITLESGVSLEGKNQDKTLISGTVTMKNGTSLTKVTVSGSGGVLVEKDAKIKLKNVKIKGASTGIKTVVGKGRVTAEGVKIFSGGKGMYLQSGNDVKITNCDVSNNKEEGIDIRSNVSGTISGNSIIGNGESGIEVILGKADLVISGNSIKKNKASGIATQYYSGMGKTGAVKIKNNVISGNSHYGVDCKMPSGGHSPSGFWNNSLDMSSNKLIDNKNGNFAPRCSLPELARQGAVLTKEEKEAAIKKIEEEKKKKEEALKKEREDSLIQREKKENEEREETLRRLEQERQQKEQELKEKENAVNKLLGELEIIETADQGDNLELNKRSKFSLFFLGANQQAIQQIESRRAEFQSNAELSQQNIFQIENETKRADYQEKLSYFKKKRSEVEQNVKEKREKKGVFGWIFKLKK